MIADLKPYAEYQESGLPWIGQVPGHWGTRRLRHACEMQVSNVDKHSKRGETPVRLCNYMDVYKNERINESIRFMTATASEEERVRFGLRKGDVLITKDSEEWNDIGVPALVECEAWDLICGYHLAILHPRPGLYGAYLHRTIKSHFIAAQFHVEANGVTRYGLSQGAIQGVAIPLPPPEEQAAIAKFLDWANGRLERAIRAKRKMIALLNEQKQAIIHRAVTRGLVPSVPLKPSGVPWLGEVPQHWTISRVKNEFRCLNTRRVPLNSVERGAMTSRVYNYYGASGVIDKVDDFLFDGDLLLIAEDGANLVLRNLPLAIVASGKFWVNNHAHILKPRRGSIVFLAHLLETMDYEPWISGAAQPKLTQDRLLSISIAVPPPDEQETIAQDISSKTGPLDASNVRLAREIELLREYRTRLVADVVTGKLDVREAAARLPEKTDEPEAGDEIVLSEDVADEDGDAPVGELAEPLAQT